MDPALEIFLSDISGGRGLGASTWREITAKYNKYFSRRVNTKLSKLLVKEVV